MQHVIGMELLFKDWIVKNWLNMQDEQWLETKQMNKVVVKISVTFYSKVWQHQNEVLHDNGKYSKYVIEWHRQLNDEIEKGYKLNMKKYARMQKLDVKKCDTGYI